ncbi:MAG: class I SAM-dependent methyltransferase [Bacteroidota bacterium]|nr:class I SAM-dependent methyltransferase [Bacteroidota bacterium]
MNRFSNRVENYIKYRPSYPADAVAFLKAEGLLNSSARIADIGSGTGISAELFLKEGYTVLGVEPNDEMRLAAENLIGHYTDFKSVNATAEDTSLEKDSVDLIIAGQAFHWFDTVRCKREFKRILNKNGFVVLMWNDRRIKSSLFLQAYEDFIRMFATDYLEVNHKNIEDKVFEEFFDGEYKTKTFLNNHLLDLEGLKGRVLSSSYMPAEEHKDFDFMMSVLKKIFTRFQENGTVNIEYDTRIYYGKLNK